MLSDFTNNTPILNEQVECLASTVIKILSISIPCSCKIIELVDASLWVLPKKNPAR